VLATEVEACERYDATSRFMKWGNHFIAKHDNCCAFAGSKDTAVLRAKQRSCDKGKVVIVDEHCRIRAINDHEGRRFAMGIFNTSLPEHVFAFERATLRDYWVRMLQVCLCVCMFVITPVLHLTFEQAIPAAPAAVLAAQGEVEVRCFSPRMPPWFTRLLVLQVSAMHPAVQAMKVRVVQPCVWVQYAASCAACTTCHRLTSLTHDVRLLRHSALQRREVTLRLFRTS
jgi:hypothetical protein